MLRRAQESRINMEDGITWPASRHWGHHWVRRFGQLLFPFDCSLCGLDCERDQPLCNSCEASLKRNSLHCRSCALPLVHTARYEHPTSCGNCLNNPPPFDAVIAPWLYDPAMGRLIGQWKYHSKHWLTPLLADLWIQQYQQTAVYQCSHNQVDLLVPVPIASVRLIRRGFNQARLLATEILRRLPADCRPAVDYTLLRRAKHVGAQARLGARARHANIDHAFTVHRACDNLRVAVVDDVVTTTATAGEIATELKRRGATWVEIWCIARTPLPGTPLNDVGKVRD